MRSATYREASDATVEIPSWRLRSPSVHHGRAILMHQSQGLGCYGAGTYRQRTLVRKSALTCASDTVSPYKCISKLCRHTLHSPSMDDDVHVLDAGGRLDGFRWHKNPTCAPTRR